MMVNWEFMDNMTPESATQLVDDLRAGAEVRSTRGPRVGHLARGRAGARRLPRRPGRRGPAAGPASLVGLRIARERGWTAPDADASPRPPSRRTTSEPDTLTPVLTDNWDDDRAWTLAGLRGARRLRRAARRPCGMEPDDVIDRGQGLRPARPRRRGLPDRHEVELHPAGQPEAEVPRRQRRRVRAGHLQGHPADDGQPAHADRGRDHQPLRDPRQHRVHLRPRRGAARRTPSAARRRRGLRAPVTSARTSTAPATTSTSSSTPAPAPTSAARRPRCSTRSRAVRGQPRLRPPFPAVAGLYASPTVINNVESIASVPSIIAQRRRVVRLDGHREVQGLRDLSPLRSRRRARSVRSAARHHAARR